MLKCYCHLISILTLSATLSTQEHLSRELPQDLAHQVLLIFDNFITVLSASSRESDGNKMRAVGREGGGRERHTHTHSHAHKYSLTYSHTHSFTHSPPPPPTHTHSLPLPLPPQHTFTHSRAHSDSNTHTHTHTHTLTSTSSPGRIYFLNPLHTPNLTRNHSHTDSHTNYPPPPPHTHTPTPTPTHFLLSTYSDKNVKQSNYDAHN